MGSCEPKVFDFPVIKWDINSPIGGSELAFGIIITMTALGGLAGHNDAFELSTKNRLGYLSLALFVGQLIIMTPMLYGNSIITP